MLLVHAQYDIDADAFMDILDAHQPEVVTSIMHFSPLIFCQQKGKLHDSKTYFTKRTTEQGELLINFDFLGDSSLGYSHNYECTRT